MISELLITVVEYYIVYTSHCVGLTVSAMSFILYAIFICEAIS